MEDINPGEVTILVVDDAPTYRKVLQETLAPKGFDLQFATDGESAIQLAERFHPDLILLDVMMPGIDGFETCRQLKGQDQTRGIPVIFITSVNETQPMVEGFRLGAVDYITKPFQSEEVLIRVENHLRMHDLTRTLKQRNEELTALTEKLRSEIARREEAEEVLSVFSEQDARRYGVSSFVGQSSAFKRTLREIHRLWGFDKASVLIVGESGTGKELVARAIHHGTEGPRGPFVTVNCSTIPHELAESTLFGHVKGAFPGATQGRKGCFERAHKGTLFLDEIGDMPIELQAKILRVLEEGEISPMGSKTKRRVAVRLLAATNAELESAIAAGSFGKELYDRLAEFILEVPPLRERMQDILLLAEHFLERFAGEMGMPKPLLSHGASEVLETYEFPGNVRELRNVIERALIESGGATIGAEHIHVLSEAFGQRPDRPSKVGGKSARSPEAQTAEDASEEQQILAFVRDKGSINNAECRELLSVGMHRAWYLLRKLQRGSQLEQEKTGRWTQYRLPGGGSNRVV